MSSATDFGCQPALRPFGHPHALRENHPTSCKSGDHTVPLESQARWAFSWKA